MVDERLLEGLRREAGLMAALRHPNVVRPPGLEMHVGNRRGCIPSPSLWVSKGLQHISFIQCAGNKVSAISATSSVLQLADCDCACDYAVRPL